MTVFVDILIKHDLTGKSAQVKRVFAHGACHMFTDGQIEELHAMAERIGMRQSWFQNDNPDLPHYDLSPARRSRAVDFGAVECDKHTTVKVMRANRAARGGQR